MVYRGDRVGRVLNECVGWVLSPVVHFELVEKSEVKRSTSEKSVVVEGGGMRQ